MPTLEIAPTVARYNVPLEEIYALHSGRRIVVGVAIFSEFNDMDGPRKKLLLLQRSASEDTFPLMYEIPGGHAEPEDDTILATVVRETMEETGLSVTRVLGEFEGFEYESSAGETTRQINFTVDVDSTNLDIKLNPDEHQAFAWVGAEEDLKQLSLTGSMVQVVLDALKLVSQPS